MLKQDRYTIGILRDSAAVPFLPIYLHLFRKVTGTAYDTGTRGAWTVGEKSLVFWFCFWK